LPQHAISGVAPYCVFWLLAISGFAPYFKLLAISVFLGWLEPHVFSFFVEP